MSASEKEKQPPFVFSNDNQKIIEHIRETPVYLNLKKLKFKGYLDNLPLDGNLKEDYLYLIYHLN